MNILAIKPGQQLSAEAAKYLDDSLDTRSDEGSLYIWESNFTPMWARVQKGEGSVIDLLEEAAIHSFLSSIPCADFYLMRAGAECGTRGGWEQHPFRDNEAVLAVAGAYRAETNRLEAEEEVVRLVSEAAAPGGVVPREFHRPGGWLERAFKALGHLSGHSTGAALKPIRLDAVFADAPGELGTAWAELCEAENHLAVRLAQLEPGTRVLNGPDAWYLQDVDGQRVLMHAVLVDGEPQEGSSRFDFDLGWVDIDAEELRDYAARVSASAGICEELGRLQASLCGSRRHTLACEEEQSSMPHSITVELISAEHGFDDFDVAGHGEVHRICIGHGIQTGELFNAYGPGSTKRGVTWKGSVERSLGSFFGVEAKAIHVLPAAPELAVEPRPDDAVPRPRM